MSVFQAKSYQGPGLPLLVMFWILLFTIIFRKGLLRLLIKVSKRVFEIKVPEDFDENFKNYFSSMHDDDRTWELDEERNNREKLNFKRKLDEYYEKIQNFTKCENRI